MNPHDSPESAQSLLNRSSWMPHFSPGCRVSELQGGPTTNPWNLLDTWKPFALGKTVSDPQEATWSDFLIFFLQEIKKDSTFSCALGKLSSYVESNSNFLELGQQHPTMTGCRFISNLWLCDFGFHGSLNNAGIISLPSHLCWLPQLGTLQSSGSFHRLWSHTRAREVACPHRDHNENNLHNGQGSMYASMMPHKVP